MQVLFYERFTNLSVSFFQKSPKAAEMCRRVLAIIVFLFASKHIVLELDIARAQRSSSMRTIVPALWAHRGFNVTIHGIYSARVSALTLLRHLHIFVRELRRQHDFFEDYHVQGLKEFVRESSCNKLKII